MNKLSKQVKDILKCKNVYDCDVALYHEVISYIPYFQNIKEEDYITYNNNKFEYTPNFKSFIDSLFNARLVEDIDEMKTFLSKYKSEFPYKLWMKDMNIILEDEDLFDKVNLSFLKKTLLSIIRLENILPGSWGIDVEAGNWLKILLQLKKILPNLKIKVK